MQFKFLFIYSDINYIIYELYLNILASKRKNCENTMKVFLLHSNNNKFVKLSSKLQSINWKIN